jgi:methylsterol monooxygenase
MGIRNSTFPSASPETYWGHFEEISGYNTQLNIAERLWAAWYAWMQNDVLATGIMSFAMHELIYFGRSLPWILIDTFGFFNNYKIQSVSFEFLSIVIVSPAYLIRAKSRPCENSGTARNSFF